MNNYRVKDIKCCASCKNKSEHNGFITCPIQSSEYQVVAVEALGICDDYESPKNEQSR
jgi:hypothetical protein